MSKLNKWKLLVSIALFLIVVSISVSGCSNMSTISSFPLVVYAPMDNKTIWAYTEMEEIATPKATPCSIPIRPTSIYLSDGRGYLSANDAKLLTQIPFEYKPPTSKEVVKGEPILINVSKLTPTNDWVVIEEILFVKFGNWKYFNLIAINTKTKQQRKIGEGDYGGGMHFEYVVKNSYVLWKTEALDAITNANIMNLMI